MLDRRAPAGRILLNTDACPRYQAGTNREGHMDRVSDGFTADAAEDRDGAMVVRPGRSPTSPEREERIRKWREENADAIKAHDAYVERHGIPFAAHRKF